MHRAREIIQRAVTGGLGTLSDDGNPFVTLVTVVATGPTTMVMLLSGLAKHTKHLGQRPNCSLLLVESGGESGDPLSGARLTIVGTAKRLDRDVDSEARAAFLEKHPLASTYTEFADFAFYEIHVEEAHLVAGFGRVETLGSSDL
jgi:hypothetical protein